jgi:hemerythrin-like domain-containing protein
VINERDGVVYQVVTNTLSADNNTINNECIRMDKEGKITGVTHVTYIRRKK